MGLLDYLPEQEYNDWKDEQKRQQLERQRQQAFEETERQSFLGRTAWQRSFSQPEPTRPFGPLPAGYYPQPAPEPSFPEGQQPEPTPWQRAWEDRSHVGTPTSTGFPAEGSQPQPTLLDNIRERLGQVGPAVARDIRNPMPVLNQAMEGMLQVQDIAVPGSAAIIGDDIGRALGIQTERSDMERGSPQQYGAIAQKALDQGMVGLLPEGPARGVAGAMGEAANRAITRGYGIPVYGPAKMGKEAIDLLRSPEQQGQLKQDWERWQTEKRNPFLDLANPAGFVNPPKMVGKAPGVLLSHALGDKAGVVKEGIGAAREGVEAIRQAIPEVGQAAGRLGRTLADERGSIGKPVLPQKEEYAPTFYSQLQRVIETKMGRTAPATDLQGLVRSQGVKSDELKWTGFDDFLNQKAAKGEKVTKDEALEFLRQNEIKVEEVVKGSQPARKAGELPEGYTVKEWNGDFGLVEPDGNLIASGYGSQDELMGDLENILEGRGTPEPSSAATPRHSQWQLPGGENYRELLLTVPEKRPTGYEEYAKEYRLFNPGVPEREIEVNYNRFTTGDIRAKPPERVAYKSTHYSEPNILAHVRFNERTDAAGKKVLFVEEIQSDWHQTGREKGYKQGIKQENYATWGKRQGMSEDAITATWHTDDPRYLEYKSIQTEALRDTSRVPAAPFSKTWPELAFKRVLRWAAENDFDRVAWTTGKQQAERYDLAKQVKHIAWEANDDGTFNISAPQPDGSPGIYKEDLTHAELKELVGKDITDRILNGVGTPETGETGYRDWRVLEGENLTIGGEGMKGFYDVMLPSTVEKYVRKWGARVGTADISVPTGKEASKAGNKTTSVHAFDVTPSMKQSVLYEGQQLGQADLGAAIDLGSGAIGAAASYDPNATPEENAARMLAGAAAGAGIGHVARTGKIGMTVEDVSKKLPKPEQGGMFNPGEVPVQFPNKPIMGAKAVAPEPVAPITDPTSDAARAKETAMWEAKTQGAPTEQIEAMREEYPGKSAVAPEQATPEGTRYNPKLTAEAHALPDGTIEVGPKFFDLPESSQQGILAHERAHISGLEEAALAEPEFWRMLQQEQMFGPLNPESGEILRGINGQFKPGENVVEAYSVLMAEPEWLRTNYPKAYEYVGELAQRQGMPVPDEFFSGRMQAIDEPGATILPTEGPEPVPTSVGASQPSLMKTAQVTEAKLPAELSKAAPRYKTQQLNFESDVDRALYIVAKTDPLSKRDADYMAFLREQFPDRSDAELRRMGGYVRSTVGKKAGSTPSEQVAILHKDVSNHLAGLQKKAGALPPPVKASEATATTRERKPLWADWGAPTTEEVYPKAAAAGEIPTQTPGGRIPGGPGNIVPSVSPDPYEQLKAARTPTRATVGERLDDMGKRLLREVYDKTLDLKPIEEATGIPAYKMAALVNGAVAYGEALARKHIIPVFDSVGKNVQALEDYMIGMRLQDILARNPHAKLPGNIDGWQGALKALKTLESTLPKEELATVKKAAEDLWRLNDELVLQPRLEAGLLSKEQYNAIKANNPHYISFYREDFVGLQESMSRGASPASVSSSGLDVMDLAGSTRKLDNPLARFQAQVIHTQKLISQNRAAKTVVEALGAMEVLPGRTGGAREAMKTGETWAKVLKPSEAAEQSQIWGTISYMDEGKKVTVQVPKVYADIAKGLEAETADALTSMFRVASTGLRAGAVTFNVAFTPKNVIRDMVSAYYREGLVPWSKEYMDGWRAAWNMEKNEDFMKAATDGVLMSGIVETMRDTKALSAANRLGAIKVGNAKDALLLFPRLVERFGVMSEQATRIATNKMLANQGVDALSGAVRSRDVTVDFAKSGNFMKLLNQAVPFANAGVQGGVNVLRTMKSNPKQAVMGAAPLVTLTVMSYAWNQRYETAKDIPDYERANNWVFIIGEGTQNADPEQPNKPGKKFPIYIKVPKGPLGAFITAPFETMLDIAWAKDNRSVLEHLLQGGNRMVSSLSPIEPSALLTPVGNLGAGLLTGVDPWRQEDIVPKGEKTRFANAPEMQYGPETSKTAILMEKALSLGGRYHVSPRMIEWAIKSYAAGVGQQGLWLADTALGALGYDPSAFGGDQRRELSGWEQAAKLPVASGFVGTRNTQQQNLGWDAFNQAVGESQREFAKVPQLRSLGVMPGQVSDTVSIGKLKIALEPAERAELQKDSTVAMLERAQPMLSDPKFSNLPVELQKKLLTNAFNAGRERARLAYIGKIPKEDMNRRIRESIPMALNP